MSVSSGETTRDLCLDGPWLSSFPILNNKIEYGNGGSFRQEGFKIEVKKQSTISWGHQPN